jgi:glucokinase
MTDVAIAVDVGGTGIKCALVDPAGEFRYSTRRTTGREHGPAKVLATILATAEELAATARERGLTPVACGVVVPGVVDEQVGILHLSANLGLREVPLRKVVQNRLGLPAALGHDVRAGALAESRLGAGRTTRRMLFIAIGTGIAGGFALDGRIDPGAHGASGEIGHIAVRGGPDARPCGCGGRGCLEVYASAAAIAKAYGEDATEVVRRAQSGEARASEVWGEAIEALADGLLVGIALYDPRVIVLGGGLSSAGTFLTEPLTKNLAQRRTFHQLPELVTAQLGDEAGCHGAALLALDLLAGEGSQW